MGEGEEKLTLKRGAFVLIQGGKNRSLYGEVEGLDPDAGRVMLKLGVGGATVSVSENVVKLVTNKEFKEKEKERLKKEDDEIQVLREKKSKKEKKHKRSRSRSRSPKMKKAKTGKTWVRPELRVRCVDKRSEEYKGKLIVVDVTTAETCDCRTAQGKL